MGDTSSHQQPLPLRPQIGTLDIHGRPRLKAWAKPWVSAFRVQQMAAGFMMVRKGLVNLAISWLPMGWLRQINAGLNTSIWLVSDYSGWLTMNCSNVCIRWCGRSFTRMVDWNGRTTRMWIPRITLVHWRDTSNIFMWGILERIVSVFGFVITVPLMIKIINVNTPTIAIRIVIIRLTIISIHDLI